MKNIQPLPKDIVNDIDKLQNRWSDELDIHAEPLVDVKNLVFTLVISYICASDYAVLCIITKSIKIIN